MTQRNFQRGPRTPEPRELEEVLSPRELERLFGRTRAPSSSPRLHLFLFGATLVTTTIAGSLDAGVDPFSSPFAFVAGLPFSLTLLSILLFHEFGHYILARRHGIPTSLPYFIPGLPILVGTFGAFIRMNGMPRTRAALFDVGAAGPWAGMVVAVPAVVVGLLLSEVRPLADLGPIPEDFGVIYTFGNSLLFEMLSRVVLGVDPDSVTVMLHPVAVAGWFGLFVTFLNLLPVGQLDGGHVVYALLGRGHRVIARVVLVVVVALGLYGWQGWLLWAAMLAFVLKVDHPDTLDAHTPLDPFRRKAAWATIAMFVLVFMPVPLDVILPEDLPGRRPAVERRLEPSPRRGPAAGLTPVDVSIPVPAGVPRST